VRAGLQAAVCRQGWRSSASSPHRYFLFRWTAVNLCRVGHAATGLWLLPPSPCRSNVGCSKRPQVFKSRVQPPIARYVTFKLPSESAENPRCRGVLCAPRCEVSTGQGRRACTWLRRDSATCIWRQSRSWSSPEFPVTLAFEFHGPHRVDDLCLRLKIAPGSLLRGIAFARRLNACLANHRRPRVTDRWRPGLMLRVWPLFQRRLSPKLELLPAPWERCAPKFFCPVQLAEWDDAKLYAVSDQESHMWHAAMP